MKKIIVMLCACLLLTGCSKDTDMFITIQEDWGYRIVYHKDTKVMYAISRNFTLLVDPDGNPMIYTESEG